MNTNSKLRIQAVRKSVATSLALGLTSLSGHSATILETTFAPTGAVISQADFSGTLNASQDYSDNGGPPGQTFTPQSDFTLTSFTLKAGRIGGGASNGGGMPTGTLNMQLQIGSVNTGTGAITEIATESGSFTPSSSTTENYLTFTLANPIALTSGTVYGISVLSDQGFLGFDVGSGDLYAGGTAFNNNTTTTSAGNADPRRTFNGVVTPRAYDRTFYVNGAVPEPSSSAILAIASLVMLGTRRRSR